MNFRRILSKSSLRSSTSSGKSLNQIDEIKKFQDQIESLTLNVSSLKVLLENREAAIGKLAREKEKLYVEVKTLQRTNRNLQQELIGEREMHSKQKVFLLDNAKRIQNKLTNNRILDATLGEEDYISALQNEIKTKDLVIYKICTKYLKLKKSKEELQEKFLILQKYTQETFESVVTSLGDNKNSLDILLDEIRKSATMTPSHKKYIKLLKINADLNFENTQLKLRLIPKNELESNSRKPETETSILVIPECSQSDDQNVMRKSSHNFEQYFRYSKTSASKVVNVISRLKNIDAFTKYNKTIRYRTMSDSLLPKNFYK